MDGQSFGILESSQRGPFGDKKWRAGWGVPAEFIQLATGIGRLGVFWLNFAFIRVLAHFRFHQRFAAQYWAFSGLQPK